jgi:hypothetical protein
VSNVVNLNKFRKKKKREGEVKQAEQNRIRHGRTKAEKERELAERARLARLVDGHRLDHDTGPRPDPAGGDADSAPEPPADEHA